MNTSAKKEHDQEASKLFNQQERERSNRPALELMLNYLIDEGKLLNDPTFVYLLMMGKERLSQL
jgi:hypothetical protein